ncbi:CDP-diacylglycerol--glycerol-3-phosphate 3-phosphatidyltransferase [Entophlyctis luteolus]|nr:CDP-diacylglycerol--glycerol-3-phosphate 3-phosphatidyltransferase [Entophlyctis luteolus]
MPDTRTHEHDQQVQVLDSPDAFLACLQGLIAGARERVVLSSLYCDRTLLPPLRQRLRECPQLRVRVAVDLRRGLRRSSVPQSVSCVDLLKTLLVDDSPQSQNANAAADRVSVALFNLPPPSPLVGSLLRVLPARLNEGPAALLHVKAYVVDNDVILSGANLSSDYFSMRQDRYILVRDCAALANYFVALVDCISENSPARLGRAAVPKDLDHTGNAGTASVAVIQNRVRSLAEVAQSFKRFRENNRDNKPIMLADNKTTVTPFVHAGPLGIHTESDVLSKLLRSVSDDSSARVVVASAYFNLPTNFHRLILDSKAKFDFILAAPEANSFFNSKGISYHIPFAYTYLAHLFWRKVEKINRQSDVNILEYKRAGWTYHAKGVGLMNEGKAPHLTVIGSSNFGYRSFSRDLEAQVIIQTTNPYLQKRLADNLDKLRQHCVRVDSRDFLSPARRPSWFARVAARIAKRML